jgi:hypothetical protein
VQLVREAVKGPVLVRIVEVEDVLGDDVDLADPRSRGLELGKGGQASLRGGLLRRLLSPAGPGEGGQANEQAIPN